jgi:hypothetical protein
MLVAMRRDPVDGGLYYVFGEENSSADVTVAGQLIMRSLLVPDPRFIEQAPRPPTVRAPMVRRTGCCRGMACCVLHGS